MTITASRYKAVLNARYLRFGVDASFTSPATKQPATLRMIDLTKGITNGQDFAEVATVSPIATARNSDLAALGFDPADLVGTIILLNGAQWEASSFAPHPGPFGPDLGQTYFTLEAPCS